MACQPFYLEYAANQFAPGDLILIHQYGWAIVLKVYHDCKWKRILRKLGIKIRINQTKVIKHAINR